MNDFHNSRKIFRDRTSGSVQIVNRLINSLKSDVKSLKEFPVPGFLNFINDLLRSFPEMQVVEHFANYILKEVKNDNSQAHVTKCLENYLETWSAIPEKLTTQLRGRLHLKSFTVLLHSNSKTIIDVLQQLKKEGYQINVIQTEGRPLLEGRRQAKALCDVGFDVNLIVDAGFPRFAEEIDYCFLGADRIAYDFIINKIGSYGIAQFCYAHDIPVFVIADPRKITQLKADPELPKPTNEIWEEAPAELNISNFYFDAIPKTLVEIITC